MSTFATTLWNRALANPFELQELDCRELDTIEYGELLRAGVIGINDTNDEEEAEE